MASRPPVSPRTYSQIADSGSRKTAMAYGAQHYSQSAADTYTTIGSPGGHHYHGDYYAASQMGGNSGGHGNHNTIFNGGDESLEVALEKIQARMHAGKMDEVDHYEVLSRLGKVKKELNKLLDLHSKLDSEARRGLEALQK